MADATDKNSQRTTAGRMREKAEENPLAVLAGGIAIGAVLGALIPRFKKEREMLAPVGKKIAESTSSAIKAARETGKAEIDALLPDKGQAKDKMGEVFSHVIEAAKGATKKG